MTDGYGDGSSTPYVPSVQANTNRIRDIAGALDSLADRLQGIGTSADADVVQLTANWDGDAADRFRDFWTRSMTTGDPMWAVYGGVDTSLTPIQKVLLNVRSMAENLRNWAMAYDMAKARNDQIFFEGIPMMVILFLTGGAALPEELTVGGVLTAAGIWAIGGGAIGAGMSVGDQVIYNMDVNHDSFGSALAGVDPVQVAVSAGEGTVQGAIMGATAGLLGGLGGKIGGVAGEVAVSPLVAAPVFAAESFGLDLATQQLQILAAGHGQLDFGQADDAAAMGVLIGFTPFSRGGATGAVSARPEPEPVWIVGLDSTGRDVLFLGAGTADGTSFRISLPGAGEPGVAYFTSDLSAVKVLPAGGAPFELTPERVVLLTGDPASPRPLAQMTVATEDGAIGGVTIRAGDPVVVRAAPDGNEIWVRGGDGEFVLAGRIVLDGSGGGLVVDPEGSVVGVWKDGQVVPLLRAPDGVTDVSAVVGGRDGGTFRISESGDRTLVGSDGRPIATVTSDGRLVFHQAGDAPEAAPVAQVRLRTVAAVDEGGLGWQPSDAQRALSELPPRIPADQFHGIVEGTNTTYVVPFDGPDGATGRAIYKPETGVPGHETGAADVPPDELRWPRELAAYGTSEMLGFGLVPTTTEAAFETAGAGGIGSLQEWVPGDPALTPGEYARVDQMKMAAFDWVTGQWDRTAENYLTDSNGFPVAIDNGSTFPAAEGARVWSPFVDAWRGRELDPEVIDAVRALSPDAFRHMLLDHGIGERAADLAVRRLVQVQDGGMIPDSDTGPQLVGYRGADMPHLPAGGGGEEAPPTVGEAWSDFEMSGSVARARAAIESGQKAEAGTFLGVARTLLDRVDRAMAAEPDGAIWRSDLDRWRAELDSLDGQRMALPDHAPPPDPWWSRTPQVSLNDLGLDLQFTSMPAPSDLPLQPEFTEAYWRLALFRFWYDAQADRMGGWENTGIRDAVDHFLETSVQRYHDVYKSIYEHRIDEQLLLSDERTDPMSARAWAGIGRILNEARELQAEIDRALPPDVDYATRGRELLDEQYGRIREAIDHVRSSYLYDGHTLEVVGSASRGYRGIQKGLTTIDPRKFDIDLYVVVDRQHFDDLAARKLAAQRAADLGPDTRDDPDKIFVDPSLKGLWNFRTAVVKALADELKGIRGIDVEELLNESTIAIRHEEPPAVQRQLAVDAALSYPDLTYLGHPLELDGRPSAYHPPFEFRVEVSPEEFQALAAEKHAAEAAAGRLPDWRDGSGHIFVDGSLPEARGLLNRVIAVMQEDLAGIPGIDMEAIAESTLVIRLGSVLDV